MSLSVQQLVKIYGAQKAVNGISCTIQPGEIAGFLGPNGVVKMTPKSNRGLFETRCRKSNGMRY